MNLPMDFRGGIARLPSMLENVVARINTLWNKQHKQDGTHGNVTAVHVTADSLDIGDYNGRYTTHKGKPLLGVGKQPVPAGASKPDFTSALSVGHLNLIGDENVYLFSGKQITASAALGVLIQASNTYMTVDTTSVTVNGRLNAYKNPHALNSEGDTHGALVLTTRSEPTNQRKWRIYNYLKHLCFDRVNDAENAIVDGPVIQFTPNGNINAAGLGTTPINGANITPGTLPPPTMPANIAYTNVNNNFTVPQTVPSEFKIEGPNGQLFMRDTSSPVNRTLWRMLGYSNGNLYVEALRNPLSGIDVQFTFGRDGNFSTTGLVTGTVAASSDVTASGTVVASGSITSTTGYLHAPAAHIAAGTGVYAGTDFYERGRATPQGHWINQPYSPAYFSGSSGMTVDVQPAAYIANAYTLVGMTLTWNLYIAGATLGTAAGTTIYITLPGGLTGWGMGMAVGELYAPAEGWMPCYVAMEGGSTRVAVTKYTKLAFTGTTPLYIRFTIQIQIG